MQITGVTNTAIAHDYSTFQRACILFLFSRLPGMTRLVCCFRKQALADFCRFGRLDDDTMKRIGDCEGPTITTSDVTDGTDED